VNIEEFEEEKTRLQKERQERCADIIRVYHDYAAY